MVKRLALLLLPALILMLSGVAFAQDQDRDQIQQRIRQYVSDLAQQPERARLREHVTADVPDAEMDRVLERARDRQFQVVDVADIQVLGDRATATVRLRQRDGTELTWSMELLRERDQWRIRNPDLTQEAPAAPPGAVAGAEAGPPAVTALPRTGGPALPVGAAALAGVALAAVGLLLRRR
ncbi:MAG: hypothetical protein HYU88_09100 [Chloroflexi bacterium]|nr:hypothetical protein [Chloroflexota bacterium]MBI4507517.1 hypothetical protein [Chloroflexota bacterium]